MLRVPSFIAGAIVAAETDGLATLPAKERQLLEWLFFEERDKDEICRTLGIDRNYLRVLLHRAKQRFKAEYVAS